MAEHSIGLVFLILACFLKFCVAQYAVPDIKFEAFSPKGLRVSIPAEKGVELFGFHGKLNKAILQIEPGEFSEDITRPQNGRFTYINPSIKLKEGDIIHYWVFVQHDQLGFRKDDQSWTVDRLLPQKDLERSPDETCASSITKVLNKDGICSGEEILSYRFTESTIDPQIWLIEQYIPAKPDWEYVIYKNEPDVINVENNALRIRPKVVEENAMKDLNIDGCTRETNAECNRPFQAIYQNPIVSGRIASKDAFCFGNITIRAKLPLGDWLYPEIFLEDINDARRKILIAFARGNKLLTGNDGNDIGGKLLFGGPHADPKEPGRSRYLASYLHNAPIGEDWHVFTIKWTKDQMHLYIDNNNYGLINADALQATGFNRETMVRLILGVGAGGQHAFPDGYTSTSGEKPWRNVARSAIKDFLSKKDQWQQTWTGVNQLLVDYVIVTAI